MTHALAQWGTFVNESVPLRGSYPRLFDFEKLPFKKELIDE
jgi:hypothetical protein